MDNIYIPEGYQQVMPYLILKDAAGFQNFMQTIFGATEKCKHMRDEKVIMHAEIKIGDITIMFADATKQFEAVTGAFFIYVTDADETFKKAIAEGSSLITAMADMPYGRSGGVKDPFGNIWWITTDVSSKV